MSSTERSELEPIASAGDFKLPLVVIVGPTAVGKTTLAIQLAERFNGEIVSADSRLFYRGMDIGTAKPTAQERLRVPHHLIDVADPDEIWSLALFQKKAYQAIHSIYLRHHLPFLVGGTGQFVRAIIEGWKLPEVTPNPLLRPVLTRMADSVGYLGLHAKLAILDPAAANSIDPTNIRRTIRALEVILSTGRLFSAQKASGYMLVDPLLLGFTRPRDQLYQRIDCRIDDMIEAGIVREVQKLLDRGYTPQLPTMSAIGYGEIIAYIQGKTTLEEAIMLIKRRTREFVRRQANWFKDSDPNIHWFHVNDSTIQEAVGLINDWLSAENRGQAYQDQHELII